MQLKTNSFYGNPDQRGDAAVIASMHLKAEGVITAEQHERGLFYRVRE